MIKQLIFSLAMAFPAFAQPGKDGYVFKNNPPPLRLEFKTAVREYNNSRELAQAIRKYGKFDAEVHAFAVIEKETCTIHIVRPAKRYMPEHIGHELIHCIYGAWHK